jgi:S1-C subfamily serine protease
MHRREPFDHRPSRRHSSSGTFALLFIAGLFFLIGVVGHWYWSRPAHSEQRASTPPDAEEREAIELFKSNKDSVVNVDTVAFRRGVDFRIQAVQAETGSGFIWDQDGHIVTNFHVVKDAYVNPDRLALRVVMADRKTFKAAVIAVAPDYDLAVIKITEGDPKLTPIQLGRSRDLQVGQKAYAIGNPFGLSLSMTRGIISALDREIDSPTGRPIPGAIQVDAPINPGNSGGPLLNKDGLLIGVNTSIATPSGGNVGIGFAIPVDMVVDVVKQLIKEGRMLKPDLGIRLVDQRRLRRAGYPTGVMIASLEPNSPAAQAGLVPLAIDPRTGLARPGDVLLKWNDREIRGNNDFEVFLNQSRPGDKVKLTLERNEEEIVVELTLRGV